MTNSGVSSPSKSIKSQGKSAYCASIRSNSATYSSAQSAVSRPVKLGTCSGEAEMEGSAFVGGAVFSSVGTVGVQQADSRQNAASVHRQIFRFMASSSIDRTSESQKHLIETHLKKQAIVRLAFPVVIFPCVFPECADHESLPCCAPSRSKNTTRRSFFLPALLLFSEDLEKIPSAAAIATTFSYSTGTCRSRLGQVPDSDPRYRRQNAGMLHVHIDLTNPVPPCMRACAYRKSFI